VKKTRKRSQLRLEQSTTTIHGAMDGQEEEEEEETPACAWCAAPRRQQGRALI